MIMVRESYQKQLHNLMEAVRQMGQKVLEGLELAMRALREHNRQIAESLDSWDDGVDDMNLQIEKQCTDLLALQQPVAGDLRTITSVFKIITDLERAADLAVNLGQYAMDSDAFVLLPKDDLLRLGEFAGGMVQSALEAFCVQNVAQAREVIERDRQMDKMCWELRQRVLDQLITSARRVHTQEEAKEIGDDVLLVLWSIRDLERIADHAVNIGGRTVYLVSGSKEYL
jgi:phosphate transport system protein